MSDHYKHYHLEPTMYHKRAFNEAWDKKCAFIEGYMGTRKTALSLNFFYNKFRDGKLNFLVVLCRKSLTDNWIDEIGKHLRPLDPRCEVKVFEASKRGGKRYWETMESFCGLSTWESTRVLLIPVSSFSRPPYKRPKKERALEKDRRLMANFERMKVFKALRLAHDTNRVFCVLDESTDIAGESSRSELITEGFNIFVHPECKWVLTGTPIKRSVVDLFNQAKFLCPTIFPGSRYRFMQRFLVMHRPKYITKSSIPMDQETYERILKKVSDDDVDLEEVAFNYGVSTSDLMHIRTSGGLVKNETQLKKALEPYYVVMSISDVRAEIGDFSYKEIYLPVPLSHAQIVHLKNMKKNLTLEHPDGLIDLANKMVVANKARQVLSGSILPDANLKRQGSTFSRIDCHKYAAIGGLVDKHKSLIIWCNFIGEITQVNDKLRELGISFGTIHGTVSDDKRVSAIESFNSGSIKVLTIMVSIGGLGLNLQKNCNAAVFMSPNYCHATYSQAICRIARSGQEADECYIYNFVTESTYEQKVVSIREMKKTLSQVLKKLDGKGFVDYIF